MSKSNNSPGPHGGRLDALRFLAALFIVVFHMGDSAPVPLRALHPFFSRGYLATDFFLILSGFILSKIYGPQLLAGRIDAGEFFLRRFLRNYPAHLITLCGLIAMVLAAPLLGHRLSHPERFVWSALPAQVLMMHGWGFAPGTWNVPTWTISALLVCYAVFPWSWRAILRLRTPLGVLLAACGLLVGADLLTRALFAQSLFQLAFALALWRVVPLFLTGQLLARLAETAILSPRATSLIGGAGAAAFLAVAAFDGPDLGGVAAVAAVVFACGVHPEPRGSRAVEWAAAVSFSLFFIQTLAGAAFTDGLSPRLLTAASGPALRWAVWGLGLPATLAAAVLFHHLVDEPIQRRLRRLLSARAARRAHAVASSAGQASTAAATPA